MVFQLGYVALFRDAETMRDRFRVCENPYISCFSFSSAIKATQPKITLLYPVVHVFVCLSVRPSVRTYVRPRVRVRVRTKPTSVLRKVWWPPNDSKVVSNLGFSHTHGFRGCRDRYIAQLKTPLIFRPSERPRRPNDGE